MPPALHFCIAPSQRSSPQAIPTLHNPCTLVWRSRLAPSSGALPPSYLQASQSIMLSGASISPPSAEVPPSYFHASQSIHARPALPSRFLQRRSPQAISELYQAISTLSTPSALVPSFLPCLSSSSVSLPSQQSKLNENPSIGDAFGKNALTN